MLKGIYGLFLIAVAAILVLSKRDGRRRLILAMAVSGVMVFAMRLLYPNVEPAHLVIVQALVFPIMVLTIWGGLSAVSFLKNR